MKLMTDEIKKKLLNAPTTGNVNDRKVIVKFFTPTANATWLILDAVEEGDDLALFGYCSLGMPDMAELGYVMLSDLESCTGPFGVGVERDLYFPENITLKEARKKEGLWDEREESEE